MHRHLNDSICATAPIALAASADTVDARVATSDCCAITTKTLKISSCKNPAARSRSQSPPRYEAKSEGLARFAQGTGAQRGSSRPDECPRNWGAAGSPRDPEMPAGELGMLLRWWGGGGPIQASSLSADFGHFLGLSQ
jgi:hypothetical protein